MKHFIVTRFNYTGKSNEYIRKRLELFHKYTVPSVSKLPITKWIIRSNLKLDIDAEIVSEFSEYFKDVKPPFVTTRLDNDDALLPGFCDAIQSNLEYDIIDVRGYIHDHFTGDTYESKKHTDILSPFISFVERTNKRKTVYFTGHHLMHLQKHLKIKRLQERFYFQVIHDTNQVNSLTKLGDKVNVVL